MPLHDWSRVPSGLYHHFHQDWSIEIARALNRGLLPRGTSALVEQRSGTREADVLTIKSRPALPEAEPRGGETLVIPDRPATRYVRRSNAEHDAAKANRVVVRHHLGRIVAVIEIVSPGNKDSRAALREFVEKAWDFLSQGVHLLIIDPFSPTPRDPSGLHKINWDDFVEEPFDFPPGKDRLLVSYECGVERVAYIEPVGVGDPLPAMPLFLARDYHVPVPLESTYQSAWDAAPADLRELVLTGVMPGTDGE